MFHVKSRFCIEMLGIFAVCLSIFAISDYCFAAQDENKKTVTIEQGGLDGSASAFEEDEFEDDEWLDDGELGIADPLEPVNRLFFHFNDKLYYLLLKPVATLYSHVVAKDIRICVRNVFDNLLAPVRVANNLLQGKGKESVVETQRFVINSTLGILGCGDVAKSEFGLVARDEDLGQTLGYYGSGPGFYINWPFLGPSNVRDTIGLIGDGFLDPISYVTDGELWSIAAVRSGKMVNKISLSLGDYELFTETALDPYAAVRDAYTQYRQGRIDDKGQTADKPF